MVRIIKRWVLFPYNLCGLLVPNSHEKSVYQYFKNMHRPASGTGDIVLVQCVEDIYNYSLFGRVIASLCEQCPIRVEQFVLNSLRSGESDSLKGFLRARFINGLVGKKWVGLYKSFCDGVGYRSTSLKFPLGDAIDAFRAVRCWRGLGNKDMLNSLAVDGVLVGDLINDSYLRFKPAATVDLENTYLWLIIWQAHRDIRRAKYYFSRVRPKLFITSYSSYIQHGIAVRVALQHGVRVFSFGNYQELAKELVLTNWVHTRKTDDYANGFSMLENQEQKLAQAEAALAARMSGTIDSATAYMKKSAYAETEEPVPDVHGAVVIFLHDFFDSPHVYRDMVFPDFWEWACFTIETLEQANIRFFIKPHPNQIDLSSGVLNDLIRRYPAIRMISPNITNKQLAQAGLACAVTVYGSVAHEMAYLGVPTIGCGDNPHISFDFCKTAKNKAEYAAMLKNSGQLNSDKPAMKRQSLVFYYMHNLNSSAEEKSLLDAVAKLRNDCGELALNNQQLHVLLENISVLPGFNAFISGLAGVFTTNEQA